MDWRKIRPVLTAVYTALETVDSVKVDDHLAAFQGSLTDHELTVAFNRLKKAGYIEAQDVWQQDLPYSINATEKGLRETSGWPNPDAAVRTTTRSAGRAHRGS